MLRNLFRIFSPDTSDDGNSDSNKPVIYAPLNQDAERHRINIQSLPSKANVSTLRPSASHRARLLSMRLEHIQLCSPHRCARLRQLGIATAGDLAAASPEHLASQFRASRRAQRILKQYRRAIRFAASVPGMMPRDAMLLISIHRRSARGLSQESAGQLHRDLQRFAQSSRGQIQLRGRRIPSPRRLKQWINECKESTAPSPEQARRAPIHARAA